MREDQKKAVEDIRERWVARLDSRWEERLHPRSKDGRFSSAEGAGGAGHGGGEKKNTRVSDTIKTKTGVKYPKLKKGAKYTAALDVAEATAREDERKGWIPKGTWDRVVKSLKPGDVIYQKNEDGQEVASIPGLAAMVDNRIRGGASDTMKRTIDRARKNEKTITKDMVSVAQRSGMYMDGLENAVKGASHIKDKAVRTMEKFKKKVDYKPTMADNAVNFSDVNRYTAVTNNDNIVEGTKKLVDGLKDAGYDILEVDNKFLKDGQEDSDAIYRAVHLTVRNKEGVSFELQVHSKESLAVKDLNHKEYEVQRTMEKTPEPERDADWHKKYDDLTAIQVDRWMKYYNNPKGISSLSPYDNRPKNKPQARTVFPKGKPDAKEIFNSR